MKWLILIPLLLPITAMAGDSTMVASEPPATDVIGTLAYFGVSMAASWLTGAAKKKTIRSKRWRQQIPLTNAGIMGGITAGVSQEPINIAASVVGALVASGAHKLTKRIFKGRW